MFAQRHCYKSKFGTALNTPFQPINNKQFNNGNNGNKNNTNTSNW